MPVLRVDPSKYPMVIFVTVLIIVGSLTSIFWGQCKRPSVRVDNRPHFVASEVLASETARVLEDHGNIVLLTYDNARNKLEFYDRQLKTLQSALSKHPQIKIVAREAVVPKDGDFSQEQGYLPAEDYLRILAAYPDVDAFVSLLGAPALSDKDIRNLPRRIPKFTTICLSRDGQFLKKLFREQVIQVAIVPRLTGLPVSASKPSSPRAAFDQFYQVVTTESADSMPD